MATIFTLVVFLGLAGMALDRAFVSSARVTEKNQLRDQVNSLLTILEILEDGTLFVPEKVLEARLLSPNSGLYAVILDDQGRAIWRSGSSLGIKLDAIEVATSGTESFYQLGDSIDSPFYYSFGITWILSEDREISISLVMINENRNYSQTIQSYRRELVFWLGMAGVLLLVMQIVSLRWGLRPLRQVVQELDLIEHARQMKITGVYPQEIAQLSTRINLFIENERKNLARYRNTLGDLAHSLKTPLAVLKGMMESRRDVASDNINELVDQMNRIVEYQLNRAASSQFSIMHGALDIEPVLRKLDKSLKKVYADKNIHIDWELQENSVFYGDESDLFELLGNILDNAYKWTNSSMVYRSHSTGTRDSVRSGLVIEIDDDGPGIPPDERAEVLKRGVRADQQTAGQGIGLAVVREIVERYEGALYIGSSTHGGTRIRLEFPSG